MIIKKFSFLNFFVDIKFFKLKKISLILFNISNLLYNSTNCSSPSAKKKHSFIRVSVFISQFLVASEK